MKGGQIESHFRFPPPGTYVSYKHTYNSVGHLLYNACLDLEGGFNIKNGFCLCEIPLGPIKVEVASSFFLNGILQLSSDLHFGLLYKCLISQAFLLSFLHTRLEKKRFPPLFGRQ